VDAVVGTAPHDRLADSNQYHRGVYTVSRISSGLVQTQAAVLNLNHSGHYLHWGVFQISLANLIVILAMIGVFVLALVLPFPGHGDRS